MKDIRKAVAADLEEIERIYDKIHTLEERGEIRTGWLREKYPTRETARDAISRGDMFVMDSDGRIVACGIINKRQMPEYSRCKWEYDVPDELVSVLHTLVVSPDASGKGYGRKFVAFYEDYSVKNGCPYLRIDTNERNYRARKMYASLGFREVGVVLCEFNGIEGVRLVCLEKKASVGD